jgi:phosphonate transport system ATP-binding protein
MLELRGLTKTYRTGDKALAEVSFTVPKGQVVGLIGPVRRGQVDADPLHQPARRADVGRILLSGTELTGLSPAPSAASGGGSG